MRCSRRFPEVQVIQTAKCLSVATTVTVVTVLTPPPAHTSRVEDDPWLPPTEIKEQALVEPLQVEAAGRRGVVAYSRGIRVPNVVVRRINQLDDAGSGKQFSPAGYLGDMDLNASGEVVVAWLGGDGVQVRIRGSHGRWAKPRQLAVKHGGERLWTLAPAVHMNASGAVAVWWTTTNAPHQSGPRRTWVEMAYRSARGRWHDPVQVAAFRRTGAIVDAAVGRRGDVLVTYQKGARVRTKTLVDGASWRTRRVLAAVDPERMSEPRLERAFDKPTAVVHWPTLDGDVIAVRRNHGKWWRPRELIARAEPFPPYDVALDGAGHLTAVWQREDLSVAAATWPAGGRAITHEELAPPEADEDNFSYGIDVETNRSGDTVVVWSNFDPRPQILRSVYRSSGASWGPPEVVAPPQEPISSMDAAIRANGAVDVVWLGGLTAWHARRPRS